MIGSVRTILLAATCGLVGACGTSTGTTTSSSAEGSGTGKLRVENEATSTGIVDRLVLKRGFALIAYDVDVDLQPGDAHQYTDMTEGWYDLQVEWEDGAMNEFMDQHVQDSLTTDISVSR